MTSALSLKRITLLMSVAGAAPALAGPVYETGSGGTFTYYGHFNPAYTSFDDGVDTTGELADNAASNSRIGMFVTQPYGDYELRFRLETAFGFRQTNQISQTNTPGGIDWDRTDIRHVDFRLRTPNAGTFYVGQGSMATDGLGEVGLSGTDLANYVSLSDYAGGFELRTSAGALSGITIGDAFDSYDGSRRGRVRWDSPEFAGFTFRIAYGEDILTSGNDDEFWDVGIGYEADLNGTQLEAGLGYQVRMRPGAEDREDTFGSISVLLQSGLNFTFAAGDRNTGGDYVYGKVGYLADLLPVGETAISLDYYSGGDFVTAGDESDSWGIGIVQDFDAANVEAYLGYRDYSYSDTTATSYQDASSFIIGARWRF